MTIAIGSQQELPLWLAQYEMGPSLNEPAPRNSSGETSKSLQQKMWIKWQSMRSELDLGFGKPVVALQIDRSGAGFNRTYQIYSLTKPPQLLYTLEGSTSYRAADIDLDGHVEIWADDAAAVDGFEHLPSVTLTRLQR